MSEVVGPVEVLDRSVSIMLMPSSTAQEPLPTLSRMIDTTPLENTPGLTVTTSSGSAAAASRPSIATTLPHSFSSPRKFVSNVVPSPSMIWSSATTDAL